MKRCWILQAMMCAIISRIKITDQAILIIHHNCNIYGLHLLYAWRARLEHKRVFSMVSLELHRATSRTDLVNNLTGQIEKEEVEVDWNQIISQRKMNLYGKYENRNVYTNSWYF